MAEAVPTVATRHRRVDGHGVRRSLDHASSGEQGRPDRRTRCSMSPPALVGVHKRMIPVQQRQLGSFPADAEAWDALTAWLRSLVPPVEEAPAEHVVRGRFRGSRKFGTDQKRTGRARKASPDPPRRDQARSRPAPPTRCTPDLVRAHFSVRFEKRTPKRQIQITTAKNTLDPMISERRAGRCISLRNHAAYSTTEARAANHTSTTPAASCSRAAPERLVLGDRVANRPPSCTGSPPTRPVRRDAPAITVRPCFDLRTESSPLDHRRATACCPTRLSLDARCPTTPRPSCCSMAMACCTCWPGTRGNLPAIERPMSTPRSSRSCRSAAGRIGIRACSQLTRRQLRFDPEAGRGCTSLPTGPISRRPIAAALGDEVTLHLLQRVTVGEASSWFCTPLTTTAGRNDALRVVNPPPARRVRAEL